MLRLTPIQAFLLCVALAILVAFGSYYFVFREMGSVGKFLPGVFGMLYLKLCHVSIPSNMQGIQRFFGTQNGMVWDEGNMYFLPFPFFDIWKKVSTEHLAVTAAVRGRSKDDHHLMVLGTCIITPKDVHLFNKLSPEAVEPALRSFVLEEMGAYVQENDRRTLLYYRSHRFKAEEETYGCLVRFQMNETIEINETTQRQFDMIARMKGEDNMGDAISAVSKLFPNLGDDQKYALYATLVGLEPKVMTHIVKGKGGIVLGGNSA